MHDATVKAAIIGGIVAIILSAISIIAQVAMGFWERHTRHQAELLRERKLALLSALDVIDHVYANSSFDGNPPSDPHAWDIMLARRAMNKMIVFCENPDKVVPTFMAAVGVHNPSTQQPLPYRPDGLDKFRQKVCEELGSTKIAYSDKDRAWIAKLPGAVPPLREPTPTTS